MVVLTSWECKGTLILPLLDKCVRYFFLKFWWRLFKAASVDVFQLMVNGKNFKFVLDLESAGGEDAASGNDQESEQLDSRWSLWRKWSKQLHLSR